MEPDVSLSNGEWKIMNCLWDHAPRTIMELVHTLEPSTGWSKHTVIKMLSRLGEKGAVRYEEGERARRYYPVIERRPAAMRETESFLERVYGGSLGLMMSALIHDKGLSAEELAELSALLEQAEEGGGDAT